uniref:SGT1 n=1 Tax=Kalanchoe fedtschenkoi TaxID=63787 RepID=A0A7N0U4Z5_KALFE
MASSDLESKAKEAFIDDHFELAVSLYSQAIDICPTRADLFADRAQAYIKLNALTDAVADTNKAIELDPEMAKAYLRKGTACFKLEEYQTAKAALETGAVLAPGDSRFTNLIKECELKIAEVIVEIFAKRVPPNSIKVDFGEQILSVRIDIPEEEAYHFQPRLFGKIVPAKCRYEVLSTKIEIRLAKAEPIHWTSLEYNKETGVTHKINVSTVGKGPTYPSSKPKRVDWDKLEAQVKEEEKEEKLDGDAGLNKFFADIYRGADEDMRRAMQKSFFESNGTVFKPGCTAYPHVKLSVKTYP